MYQAAIPTAENEYQYTSDGEKQQGLTKKADNGTSNSQKEGRDLVASFSNIPSRTYFGTTHLLASVHRQTDLHHKGHKRPISQRKQRTHLSHNQRPQRLIIIREPRRRSTHRRNPQRNRHDRMSQTKHRLGRAQVSTKGSKVHEEPIQRRFRGKRIRGLVCPQSR